MVTIKQVFDYRTPRSNGEIPLKLRVTHKRKTTHLTLGVSLSKEQIKKIEKGKADEELSQLMSKVDEITNNVRRVSSTLYPFSVSELKRKLLLEKEQDTGVPHLLVDVIKGKVEILDRFEKYKSKSQYITLMNMVNNYRPNTHIKDVDEKYLLGLEKWYINNRTEVSGEEGRDSYFNSLAVYMRSLKAILNYARDKRFLNNDYEFPFGKNRYVIRTFDVEKNILFPDETDLIMRFNDFDKRSKKYQENSLDHWKLCFLCNGANMKDIVQFKWTDIEDDVIRFVRKKTENKTKVIRRIDIPIIEPLQELIDKIGNKECKYIFGGFQSPPKEKTIANKVKKMCSGYNQHLKIIGKKMNLRFDLLISTSRHGYANYLSKNGVSSERIGEMMGHRDKHRLTTYHYLGSLDKKTLFDTNECLRKFKTNDNE